MEKETEKQAQSRVILTPGDPLPWVKQRWEDGIFSLAGAGGHYLVLCFYGSANHPEAKAALETMMRYRTLFDDDRACFFGISTDPADESEKRVRNSLPGIRFLWDFDATVSRRCGAASIKETALDEYNQFWLVVDPSLHVMARLQFGSAPHEQVFKFLEKLPRPERFAGFEIPAPVLVLPNVFEPKFCQYLVRLHQDHGGVDIGYVRKDVNIIDKAVKRRKDFLIDDPQVRKHIDDNVRRKVWPEIEKLFFMKITHMDRYLIGCYDAAEEAHFAPHRDNTSDLTSYRRFALSINLNSDFEGGEVAFPEYNRRGIKAPAGWAVVFPCAILHMVSKVTRGRRYVFLPFLFDDSGAVLLQKARQAKSRSSATVTLR